jgi:selenocysteine lyase/cysteine desulfurase
MNQNIRQLFPITEKFVYLNSAAVSPPPTVALDAIKAHFDDLQMNGVLSFPKWVATKNRCRALLGNLLNAKPENIAFMRNTSDSVATIANGLSWEKGDNIVSFAGEFPANFYPWRRIRDVFGVELRLCPEREGRIDLDELTGLIDSNTKVVAISAVQFASGFRADLERLSAAARKVDALLTVDAIQALGAIPFDVEAQGIDAAAGASHKWLCAPEGGGYIYLSNRALERVTPTMVGWISVQEAWDFEDREQGLQEGALSWETGTSGSSLFYGIEQSLKLLSETGIENIQAYLEELTDYLCELLAGKNYETVSSRLPGEKSQIVCIRHLNGMKPIELYRHLEAVNIIVSPRGDRLRIAPHFYNTKSEIEHLVENLP